MKFSKEFMIETVLEGGDNAEIVYDRIIDTSRWSEIHELVFKCDSRFYKTNYSCGLTECQDESPWEYEEDVEAFEVEPVEVLVTQYKKVKEG